MVNIKEILERDGEVRKFSGVAPEGFVLVHEKTLEDLKEFETWKEWKLGYLSIEELNKNNFDSEEKILSL
jgi:hypothetical protein